MSYATVQDLLERATAQELAEVGARDFRDVDGESLTAYLDDNTQPADAALREQVEIAVGRLTDALETASAEVDSYARTANPDISPDHQVAALKIYTLDIAMYRLFGGDSQSERYTRYQAALAWLRRVAKGEIDLEPAGDDGTGVGEILTGSQDRVFSRDSLGDFTDFNRGRGL